jgi:hypothetical protein
MSGPSQREFPRVSVGFPFPLRAAAVAAAALSLAGCMGGGSAPAASGGAQTSNPVSNLIFWGSTTVPAAPPLPVDDDFECPSLTISTAAHRIGGESVRAQYSIGDIARECSNPQPDGSFTLKMGVAGQVLLGPAGAPGRYDVSVRFVVKSGERIVLTRVQRQSVIVPAGATQGQFTMVEQGIQVPAGLRNLEFEVGLGAGGDAPTRRRTARR